MSEETQFKVRLAPGVQEQLEAQANALGFHSANALASVILSQVAPVPPHKVFEMFAKIEAYSPRQYKGGRRK